MTYLTMRTYVAFIALFVQEGINLQDNLDSALILRKFIYLNLIVRVFIVRHYGVITKNII